MTQNKAYREAEQKIEKARRTGATELDLSNGFRTQDDEKLAELPKLLWKLIQLQSLDLSEDQLTAVPDTICQTRTAWFLPTRLYQTPPTHKLSIGTVMR